MCALPPTTLIAARPVTLDPATVRALCDAGYVTSREYIELAAAQGWRPDSYLLERKHRLAPYRPFRNDGDAPPFASAEAGD